MSYASQDAEASKRICHVLRAAGVQVFLHQSELRGGDAWDQKIRHEIHDCVLFIPIISQHTQERLEGYFRHEWKLAVERAHHMAEQKAFLVPVVIDGTRDHDALVPDAFRAVQWTRLPQGETPPAFVDRVRLLLSGEASAAVRVQASDETTEHAPVARWMKRALPAAIAVAILGTGTYFGINKLWLSKPAASAGFAPPPHSVAVLPFVNLSGDKEQEYFSDGLTEELLNSLAQISDLQVAARTSSFSFREHPDIATVAHKLNVAAVLEGSVRRSEHTVRVTVQLINAGTGFHLWSRTYDRALGDVLQLQTEIATAVADTLKVTMLGDVVAKIETGGTRNPAALDAYLHAVKIGRAYQDAGDVQLSIAAYTEAIRLDPNYALAFARRSYELTAYAVEFAQETDRRESLDKARADAERAIMLAPDLAQGHLSLGDFFEQALDFKRANEEYQRGLALAQGSATALESYGFFAVLMGRNEAGLAAIRRAVVLDPLNRLKYDTLGDALNLSRRHGESIAAYQKGMALDPDDQTFKAFVGLQYYMLGNLANALSSCKAQVSEWHRLCLALTYHALQRQAAADDVLTAYRAL